ncbi:uncharacterized protein LOC133730606 [Rosa rugosa]|uniref:uncharacterized protein LOC133730606 n=1 Tax=Rosa rugosa TaxID=74645 RepID=UPI002B4031C5|nr:uncharacterized protein LOC133730606 [Rosa rugosa]
MSFLLPPTITLKSSYFNQYVNYSNDSDSETHGFLKVNESNVFSSLAKFEVVMANIGTGLVHIRCSQNRKFLRMRIEGDVYLSPEADESEEDQSKWSCTLFEPQVAVDGNLDKARLFHVQAMRYATSLVILPKHVAFKPSNNLYLQLGESNQLRFVSTDKGIPASWFEVSTNGDGRVQIKYYKNNAYLRFGGGDYSNWIFADGGSASKPPTLFLPIKVDTSAAALQCLSNDKFCALHTYKYDYAEGLNAPDTSTSISNLSRMRLEELVLSRRIYNADFDLKNAIIYGETPVTMATANASNNTSAENTVEFKFAYKDGKSSTWKASHSWMVGVSVSASFKIPFIGGTDVTASAEYSGSYEWGETIESENTLETTYKATVPANTSISVSLMATKGSCDVPYLYYQNDVLYSDKSIIYKKDNGVYTGVNSYNFRYETTTRKEPISIADLLDPSADPTIEQMLPDPSVNPTIEQMIPEPVPSGSTTRVQNKVKTLA